MGPLFPHPPPEGCSVLHDRAESGHVEVATGYYCGRPDIYKEFARWRWRENRAENRLGRRASSRGKRRVVARHGDTMRKKRAIHAGECLRNGNNPPKNQRTGHQETQGRAGNPLSPGHCCRPGNSNVTSGAQISQPMAGDTFAAPSSGEGRGFRAVAQARPRGACAFHLSASDRPLGRPSDRWRRVCDREHGTREAFRSTCPGPVPEHRCQGRPRSHAARKRNPNHP